MSDPNFPLWLRLNHYVNILFLTLLMRSGVQILAARPKLYWNEACKAGSEWFKIGTNRGSTGSEIDSSNQDFQVSPILAIPGGRGEAGLGLGRSWHFFSVGFWVLNGLTYTLLLFCTGQWRRLLPTSWDILPQAAHTFFELLSLHQPQSQSSIYDPLQQLSYAIVVFVMAPLSILTGAAMSNAIAAKFPWYPAVFGGRQAARSLHFILLLGFAVFAAVHISMVVVTDPLACMNRIVLGATGHQSTGAIVGLIALSLIVITHIILTVLTRKNPRAVEQAIRRAPDTFVRLALGENFAEEQITENPETADKEELLRKKILKMLTTDKLETMLEPFPETNIEFEAIRVELRELAADDLEQRLVISGFAPKPINDQRCSECMYFLVNRRWCNLPELELPVEEEWWCRLWRI